MPHLLLIKHARPVVAPRIPADQWTLGDEGRAACAPLAEALRASSPGAIVASEEPKAEQTAQIVGAALGVPVRTAPDLHEHDRSNVPHLDNREFISLMALLFAEPGRRVLGRESADEACDRFAAAVDQAIAQATETPLAIVTHGTVIALFAQRRAGVADPFQLWRRMAQPSYLVLEYPQWKVVEVRERI